MKISTISLMPDIFNTLDHGVIGRAINKGSVTCNHHQLRDFSHRKDKRVDDNPYGGTCGMLIRADIIDRAIQHTLVKTPGKVIQLCPTGKKFKQQDALELSLESHLVFVCGRYEGIDARIESRVDCKYSIGDFVLTGGELAACCMIDSIVRLLPDTVGNDKSIAEDSYQEQLLDFEHYTRPATWHRQSVPSVLLSGNHKQIKLWQEQQRLGITWLKRPDLIVGQKLSDQQVKALVTYLKTKFEE